MPRTMSRAAALAAAALLVAACGLGSPNTHTLFLAGEEPGIAELPVTITDESGNLRDVSQQIGWPPGQVPDGPSVEPARRATEGACRVDWRRMRHRRRDAAAGPGERV